jgi:hypothetical protein
MTGSGIFLGLWSLLRTFPVNLRKYDGFFPDLRMRSKLPARSKCHK